MNAGAAAPAVHGVRATGTLGDDPPHAVRPRPGRPTEDSMDAAGPGADGPARRPPFGSWIIVGLLVGSVLGILLDNIGLWPMLGIIVGAIADGSLASSRRRGSRDRR